MTVRQIIQQARTLGVFLVLEDGKIVATPASRLPEDLRAAIRGQRGAILQALADRIPEPDTGWERMRRAAARLGETVSDVQRQYQLWGVTPRGAICFDGHFYKTLDLDDLGL